MFHLALVKKVKTCLHILAQKRKGKRNTCLHIQGNSQQDVNIKFFLLVNLFYLGRELLMNVETMDM